MCSGQGDHKKAVQYFKMAAAEEPNEKVRMHYTPTVSRGDHSVALWCLGCVLVQYIQKMLQQAQQQVEGDSRREKAMYRRMIQGLGRDEGEGEREGEARQTSTSTSASLVRPSHKDL